MFNKKLTDKFKPNLNIFLQYFLQAGDINFMNLLVSLAFKVGSNFGSNFIYFGYFIFNLAKVLVKEKK